MAVAPEELAQRVARHLSERAVWIDPTLDARLAGLATGRARRVARPEDAEVTVLVAQLVAESGEVIATTEPEATPCVAWLSFADGGRIGSASRTAALRPPVSGTSPIPRATRVFTELGVLDVQGGELVIVELAPRVSAVDLQRRAEPTLRISPRVTEMRVAREDRARDNGAS